MTLSVMEAWAGGQNREGCQDKVCQRSEDSAGGVRLSPEGDLWERV